MAEDVAAFCPNQGLGIERSERLSIPSDTGGCTGRIAERRYKAEKSDVGRLHGRAFDREFRLSGTDFGRISEWTEKIVYNARRVRISMEMPAGSIA